MADATLSPAIRFALYANTAGGVGACWPWTAATNEQGYGLLRVDGRLVRAHRYALALAGVDVPPDASVCHHCDSPSCVNPRHLYVGTQATNMQDARNRERTNRGARNGAAKLTDDDVRAIRSGRAEGATLAMLARRFGVGKSTVSRVVRRDGWAHVG